jgi:hypothetical protein
MSSFDRRSLGFPRHQEKAARERKPVFPEGVPGLEQGVPKNLVQAPGRSRSTSRTPRLRPPPPRRHPRRSRNRNAAPRASSRPWRRRPRPTPHQAPDPNAAPEEEGSTAAAPPAPEAEDRAPAHHGTAARCAGPARAAAAATIRRTIPGADAERHLYALISVFHGIGGRVDSIIAA